MKLSHAVPAFLLLTTLSFAQQTPAASDLWADWTFLLGEWNAGQGGGVPGQATSGYFSLMPDLGGQILLRRNHSEYAATNGKPGVVHDDLMIVFREAGVTKAFYQDSEGHLIRYIVNLSPDKKRIVFLSEPSPGPRYRLTYEDLGHDTVNVVFEIAPPDKPEQFHRYVEGVVHRKPGSRQ